uniref:Uncharacterized protein n=1 Tax=Rhabditophanes sp. KR3021 TaxID=114890 RepID=A0AC35UIS2_9BILA
MWYQRFACYILIIFSIQTPVLVHSLKCYSCANDFIVWHWRHFFLKRNYGLSSSDNECLDELYVSDSLVSCSTSCFIFVLNGTDRNTKKTTVLGLGRGCSSQFLSEEQYMSRGLGVYSGKSYIGKHLTQNFDKYDLQENWCFCDSLKCNYQNCFRDYGRHHQAIQNYAPGWGQPPPIDNSFPDFEADNSRRRSPPSPRSSHGSDSDFWNYYATGAGQNLELSFFTLLFIMAWEVIMYW